MNKNGLLQTCTTASIILKIATFRPIVFCQDVKRVTRTKACIISSAPLKGNPKCNHQEELKKNTLKGVYCAKSVIYTNILVWNKGWALNVVEIEKQSSEGQRELVVWGGLRSEPQ